MPDFRSRVIDTDMFTPTTIRRFTGHDNGAVYGAPRQAARRHDAPEEPVPLRHRPGLRRHHRRASSAASRWRIGIVCWGHRVQRDERMSTPTEAPADASPQRRKWRFSLGTLILCSALGMAILANFLQYRHAHVESLKASRWHSKTRSELNHILDNQEFIDRYEHDDSDRINVSLVPTSGEDEWLWQIALPDGRDKYIIRFAVDGIPVDGIPTRWAMGSGGFGATWLKVKLGATCPVNRPPNDRAIEVASLSYHHDRDPATGEGGWPGLHCIGPPEDLHLWSVAGKERRESFSPKSPVVLLRMREVPPPAHDATQAADTDAPCRGLMIWIEKHP